MRSKLLTQIRQEMKEKGIKVKDLAKSLGMSPNYMTNKLAGRKKMSLDEFCKIIFLVGIEIELKNPLQNVK